MKRARSSRDRDVIHVWPAGNMKMRFKACEGKRLYEGRKELGNDIKG